MVNEAAKVHYMSGGMWKVPMVTRITLGATRRFGRAALAKAARLVLPHSRECRASLYAVRRQGLLKAAIRDDEPSNPSETR
jgi:pyruvate dehydrogenase E1 component beta subunit